MQCKFLVALVVVKRLAFMQKFLKQPNACIAGNTAPLCAKVANREVRIDPRDAFAVHARVNQAANGGHARWSRANDSPFKLCGVLLC